MPSKAHKSEPELSEFVSPPVGLLPCFRVSGCVDHFAWKEKEAFDQTRNIISTLNFQLPEEEEDTAKRKAGEEPLHSSEELLGLAPRSYSHTLDVRMVTLPKTHNTVGYADSAVSVLTGSISLSRILFAGQIVSRLTDGSRFQEFKARYGTTLVLGVCLDIIKQQQYQLSTEKRRSVLIRMGLQA
ncbi:hypothetical protein GOODEAATRI_003792 [Goodea atripinnis]|uniref:Acetyl-coenzyme A carboxylase carboxyl transferase subunit beta domain-containing protein n=1 Tax=Goodea atripinnis TaxID=208336 RepID=A0ABV0PVH6_9TELE